MIDTSSNFKQSKLCVYDDDDDDDGVHPLALLRDQTFSYGDP